MGKPKVSLSLRRCLHSQDSWQQPCALFTACRPPAHLPQMAFWSVRVSVSLYNSHGILTAAKHTKGGLTSLIPTSWLKCMTQNEKLRLVLQTVLPDVRKFRHLCNLSWKTNYQYHFLKAPGKNKQTIKCSKFPGGGFQLLPQEFWR